MNPRKIAAFALGPLGGAVLGLITIPLMTWFFSKEDIGRLAMLNVVTSFCTLFFSLGLDQAYVREFNEIKSKPKLFKVTFFPGFVLLLIVLFIFISSDNLISKLLFELDSQLLSLLVSIVVLSTFITRFLSLILRMNERGVAYSMSQLLPKLILILIIGVYITFSAGNNITNLLVANVSAALIVCIVYAWSTRDEWLASLNESIDYNYLKSLASFGMPLVFGGLAFWGLTAIDKILLTKLSNFEELALYSVAVSFAAAAAIFQSVFSIVWAPIVYKWAAVGEGLENIYKVNRYVLLVVIILFCLGGLFSWVITFVLPSNYGAVQWVLISCLGLPLFYTLSETTIVGVGVTRRSGFAMLAALLAFIINLIGNWWLIPILGAKGAAVSTCISFWLFFILRTEFAIYVWKPMPRLILYSYTSLLVIGAVVSTIYGELYNNYLTLFWSVILLSVLIFFKTEFVEAKSWILSKR